MPWAEEKIKSTTETAKICGELKKQRKIVVTTNGSFDLFHAGHVFLLEEAKKQGDVLVVGVNSDASVRSYKGSGRPIACEKERALLVAAIHCVDFVCIFEEPTCIKWLEQIKPCVHCKDKNWANEKGELIETSTVERNGGKIFLVKRKQGLSTTGIIEKILENCQKKALEKAK